MNYNLTEIKDSSTNIIKVHTCQPREKFSRDKLRPVERSEGGFGRGVRGVLPRKFSKTCIENGAI